MLNNYRTHVKIRKPKYNVQGAWSLLVNPLGEKQLIFGMKWGQILFDTGQEVLENKRDGDFEFADVIALAVEPGDSGSLFSATGAGISMWDMKTKEIKKFIPHSLNDLFAFNPENPKKYVSDARVGQKHYLNSYVQEDEEIKMLCSFGQRWPVSLTFNTEDTSQLFAGLRNGSIVILDIQQNKVLSEFKAHASEIWALACTPKRKELMIDEE